jgi:hypothetical protein
MESLDNKWILSSEESDSSCSEKDSNSPATLGLENMRGVFILVSSGPPYWRKKEKEMQCNFFYTVHVD